MRRTFKVVGTINEKTPVFGYTYGSFSRLMATAFQKQFDDIKSHDAKSGPLGGSATEAGEANPIDRVNPAAR